MPTDFSGLEADLPTPEEMREEARYWRTKAARAHSAYSSAYWDYELSEGMALNCQEFANALERDNVKNLTDAK